MMGELKLDAIACLEAQLRLERLQVYVLHLTLSNRNFNNQIGRVGRFVFEIIFGTLIVHNPISLFAFALYLQNKGPEYFKEALYWTDYVRNSKPMARGAGFCVKIQQTVPD